MPGGRLTHEDRRRIAVFLADGLGYAEIGRRMGRPTSTISREVARNGPSGTYLAERAQQISGHRARRRKPAKPSRSSSAGRTEATREFVDHFAVLLAATGLPRMTARVFTCLLAAESDGLAAADLVGRLQVSPASVSKSIAALEAMDLVARHHDPGRRRERYVIGDDVWSRAWHTDASAHVALATAAQRGIEIFGADSPAGTRFGRMGQFFDRLGHLMSSSEPAADDALTVLAALVHAGRPVTVNLLATALDWPKDRVRAALDTIRRQPNVADPLALQDIGAGTYTVIARPARLSPGQREVLESLAARR